MRIAFDLDGTLADLDAALGAVTDGLFGGAAPGAQPSAGASTEDESLTPEEERLEPARMRALTRRQQHEVWDRVRATAGFWETLDEIQPGTVARIALLAEQRGWEVLFLTQRPTVAGPTTQRQTQRWLAQHGFEMPSVFVLGVAASRGKVAAALDVDVVVDDRAENCLEVKVDSAARAFLVSPDASAEVAANAGRLGIEVVASVGECLDRLESEERPKGGLLRRIKRMMGA